jgi:hypothetical protein
MEAGMEVGITGMAAGRDGNVFITKPKQAVFVSGAIACESYN